MSRLIEHGGISILVEIEGGRHMGHQLLRSYYKPRNSLLLEEVQRWEVGDLEVQISRPVLRRPRWVLGPWQLN